MAQEVIVWAPTWEVKTRADNSWTLTCRWSSRGSASSALQDVALQRLLKHVRSVGCIEVRQGEEAKDGQASPG